MKTENLKKKDQKRNAIEKLERRLSEESVNRARLKSKEILFQINLAELRKNLGIKQEELKSFSQSSLSKLEARKDMKISTLKDYLNSLGMDLEIKARVRESNKKKLGKKEYTLISPL